MSLILALLLAQITGQVTAKPVGGTPPPFAVWVYADPLHPLPVNATVNVAGASDLPGNTATYNGNNVCSAVLTAGEQSVGFHLDAGTLGATLTAYVTQSTTAYPTLNCATSGTCTATTFSTGATIVVTNPNGLKDVAITTVPGARQIQVCSSAWSGGSTTGVVTATYLNATSSASIGTVGQGAAGTIGGSWTTVVTDLTNILGTAAHPFRVDPTGTTTQPISAASLPLPSGAAQDATLTGGSAKTIIRSGTKGTSSPADITSTAEGANNQAIDAQLWFGGSALDPRTRSWTLSGGTDSVDVSDRAARLLGVVYGSQAQQLKQTATNFNLQVEIATGGTLIDPRSIRALTSSDTVTAVQPTAANLNAQVVGAAGDTAAPSGNPVATAGIARANNVAPTANTAGNVSEFSFDLEHRLLVQDYHPNNFSSLGITVTAGNDIQAVAAPGSNTLHVTDIDFVTDAASGTIQLDYGTGVNCATGTTTFWGPFTVVANGGIAHGYRTPIRVPAAAKAICCKSSVAAHCTLEGFTAP